METKNVYSNLIASAIDQEAVVLTVAGIRSTTSVDDPLSHYLEVTLRDEEADDLGLTTIYDTLSNSGIATFLSFFNVGSLDRLIGRRVRCVLAANKSLVFFLPPGGDKSTVLSFGNADLPLLVDTRVVAAWTGVDRGDEDEDNPPVELPNFPAPGMYEVNAIEVTDEREDRIVEVTFEWDGCHVILDFQCDKLVDFDTFLRTIGMDYGSSFVVHVGEDWTVKISNTAVSCSYVSVDTEGNATIAEFSPLSKEALKRVSEVRAEYIESSIKIAAALASNLAPQDEDDVADMTDAITRRVLSRAEVAVGEATSLIRMSHEVTKS